MPQPTKPEKQCECLFCNTRCPECASLDVMVKFIPHISYDNQYENRIIFDVEGLRKLQMECKKCGKVSSSKELQLLKKALKETLCFCALHKPNGRIRIEKVPRACAGRTTGRPPDPFLEAILKRKKGRGKQDRCKPNILPVANV